MAVLTKQFQDALAAIEPGDDAKHAAEAHDEVRDLLDQDDDLIGWGLHTLLIGSYRREVSIRRVKDADVFCELPDLPEDHDPQDLLEKIATALIGTYKDRVVKNDRSVKVEFPDYDMHVDVVPARPCGDAWEIPERDGGWTKTHPDRFSELTTARNATHDKKYVPVVKLLRQTRRALLGKSKPGGLFVEVAAYHAFASIPSAGHDDAPGSIAEYYTRALEGMAPLIRTHADGSGLLTNPAVAGQELVIRATQQELDAIADEWEQAAETARTAFECDDDQKAAKLFKSLLGKNSDGNEVFTVPAESTRAAASATASALTPGYRSLPSGNSPTFG